MIEAPFQICFREKISLFTLYINKRASHNMSDYVVLNPHNETNSSSVWQIYLTKKIC